MDDERAFSSMLRPRKQPYERKHPITYKGEYDDSEDHAWHTRAIVSTIIVIIIVVAIVLFVFWWLKCKNNNTNIFAFSNPTNHAGTILKASGGKCSNNSECRDGLSCVDGRCCTSSEAKQLRAAKQPKGAQNTVPKPITAQSHLKTEQLTPTMRVTKPINPSPTEDFTIIIEQQHKKRDNDQVANIPMRDARMAIREANENGIMERMRQGSAVSDADMDFSY